MAEEEIEVGWSFDDASRLPTCQAALFRRIVGATVDIEDDVVWPARELARREKTTAGAILSAPPRKALDAPIPTVREATPLQGFQPVSKRCVIVTHMQIDKNPRGEGALC